MCNSHAQSHQKTKMSEKHTAKRKQVEAAEICKQKSRELRDAHL